MINILVLMNEFSLLVGGIYTISNFIPSRNSKGNVSVDIAVSFSINKTFKFIFIVEALLNSETCFKKYVKSNKYLLLQKKPVHN